MRFELPRGARRVVGMYEYKVCFVLRGLLRCAGVVLAISGLRSRTLMFGPRAFEVNSVWNLGVRPLLRYAELCACETKGDASDSR